MKPVKLECTISEVAPLRVPKVFRVKGSCGEIDIEVELHEEVVEIPQKGSKMLVDITTSKEVCLEHYFCAHGYVVSNVKLDDIHRVVISLHGLLVVLKSKTALEYNAMDHLYLGISLPR